MRPNVLFVTLDQFRAECLGAAGHPTLSTPHLDALAADGVHFTRHYSQTSPCSPGRASIYTGMYQMNHRVVANGTPLDARFDNIALVARRAGYTPTLFGYTDQTIDPRTLSSRDDPLLTTYEGILPGFEGKWVYTDPLRGSGIDWIEWLDTLGYDTSVGLDALLSTEHERPSEHSLAARQTDVFLDWLETQDGPWFAHLSHFRPHPPFSAAGEFSTLYADADLPTPITVDEPIHPLHAAALTIEFIIAPDTDEGTRHMITQYYGMISHIDHEMGRVFDAIKRRGEWDSTLIVVTSDHGEMLGDFGLIQKLGWFEQSYAVPCIVRDPTHPDTHGTTVTHFTENVDLLPTVCDVIGEPTPIQCDGNSLVPFLDGDTPSRWRRAAHWEYDWQGSVVGRFDVDKIAGYIPEEQHLAVVRNETHAYVQFGDGDALCFDLAADPTSRTMTDDPAIALGLAQEMLTWRSTHTDRTLTGLVVDGSARGRWPEGSPTESTETD